MSFFHIVRVFFAIMVSGAIGWLSLLGLNFVRIGKGFEAFEAAPDSGFGDLPLAMDHAIRTLSGGSAVFVAAGVAGVLLSEIFHARSLLYYAGATGALTAVLAAGPWQQSGAAGSGQAAAALAVAGFVAGTIYWTLAGHSASRT